MTPPASPRLDVHLLTLVQTKVDADFPKSGVPFWGPCNKDYSMLGSIFGSPHFEKKKMYMRGGKLLNIP